MLKINDLALFFILLPYIGFIFLPSDIQPLAFFSVLFLITIGLIKLTKVEIFGIVITSLYITTVYLITISYYKNLPILSLFRYIIPYLTPILIFSYCRTFYKIDITKVLDFVLLFIYFGYMLNILGFTWLIQLFVNRSVFEGADVRGLTSFFPEQSTIATQLVFYLFLYYIYSSLNIYRFLFIVIALIFSLSGQTIINIFVLFFLYVLFLLVKFKKSHYLSLISILASFLIAFYYVDAKFLVDLGLPSRGIYAISDLINYGFIYLLKDDGIAYKLTGFLYGVSGIVDLNYIPSIYKTQYIDKLNVDFLSHVFFNIIGKSYLIVPSNPYSIFGSLLFDHALIGLSLFILFLISYLYILSVSNFQYRIIFSFLFFLFVFHSFIAQPTFWYVLFISYFKLVYYEKKSLNIL